jgi:hypothetical protein
MQIIKRKPTKAGYGNRWDVVDTATGWTCWTFRSLKLARLYILTNLNN